MTLKLSPAPLAVNLTDWPWVSRNLLFTPEQHKSAKTISQVLFRTKELIDYFPVKDLKQFVIDTINQDPNLKVEYFEIVDAQTLLPIGGLVGKTPKPIALNSRLPTGNIRLIGPYKSYS